MLAVAAAENRRLEEMAARERQYAALATDPLVRLQMAGVNPGNFATHQNTTRINNKMESQYCFPVHHTSYGLMPPPGMGPPGGNVSRGPPTSGSYSDPRFRSPNSSDQLMRPGKITNLFKIVN